MNYSIYHLVLNKFSIKFSSMVVEYLPKNNMIRIILIGISSFMLLLVALNVNIGILLLLSAGLSIFSLNFLFKK